MLYRLYVVIAMILAFFLIVPAVILTVFTYPIFNYNAISHLMSYIDDLMR